MELIEPPPLKNSILRNGVVKSGDVIGELGIYGACVWCSDRSGRSTEILGNWGGWTPSPNEGQGK